MELSRSAICIYACYTVTVHTHHTHSEQFIDISIKCIWIKCNNNNMCNPLPTSFIMGLRMLVVAWPHCCIYTALIPCLSASILHLFSYFLALSSLHPSTFNGNIFTRFIYMYPTMQFGPWGCPHATRKRNRLASSTRHQCVAFYAYCINLLCYWNNNYPMILSIHIQLLDWMATCPLAEM